MMALQSVWCDRYTDKAQTVAAGVPYRVPAIRSFRQIPQGLV